MAELKKIATENAPAAIGPYSQAIVCGDMLFTSGQIGIDPACGEITGKTVTEQTEQTEAEVQSQGNGAVGEVQSAPESEQGGELLTPPHYFGEKR